MSSPAFTFEKIGRDDLPFLIEVRNECREFLHDNRLFTLSECERWFHETKPDFRIIRYGGERIGYFRLSNHDPKETSIYIGADLHKSFRGQGLARRAYEAFLPVVTDSYGISVVKLEVLSHNAVAHALYEKLGFIETSRKKGFTVRNGVSVDSIIMQKRLLADGSITASR
ncbi:MAG: L-phenylalanine/L-methionine N-acetyltransferase [Verrucomicrobiota bacterium]